MNKLRLLFNAHPIIYSAITLLVLIIFLVIINMVGGENTEGKYKVKITVVPKDASVFIDDAIVKDREPYLIPGSHNFRTEKEGFFKYETAIDIQQSDQAIVLMLQPKSDDAKEWAANNNKLYLEAESIAGQYANDKGEQERNDNPIIKYLPYDSIYFDIDYYKPEDNQERIIIKIRAQSSTGRQYAINQIKDWGIDPGDLEIEFVDLDNPFGDGR